MKRFILGLTLAAIFAIPIAAKTPPEVLKPYKEYRAALEAGDEKKAFKKAKEAWEIAEEILGDHKTTGDLAATYAKTSPGKNNSDYKSYKDRMKAHDRGIELASLHGEDGVDIALGRHLLRIETGLNLGKFDKDGFVGGGKTNLFTPMEKALDEFGRRGSTYEGDMEVLRARRYELRSEYEKALTASAQADTIFANATDNIVTPYPIMLKLFKGNSYRGMEQPIKAALEYQNVMQNLEGKLPADHPFIKTAFTEWMRTRSSLEDAGRLDEAEEAGLCECWPFENYKNKPLPLERIPPIMPSSARYSGYATLLFDVNENGKPFNIRITGYTSKVFAKPSAKAVSKWQYAPAGSEVDPETRRNLSTRITFKLSNERGKLIGENEYQALSTPLQIDY